MITPKAEGSPWTLSGQPCPCWPSFGWRTMHFPPTCASKFPKENCALATVPLHLLLPRPLRVLVNDFSSLRLSSNVTSFTMSSLTQSSTSTSVVTYTPMAQICHPGLVSWEGETGPDQTALFQPWHHLLPGTGPSMSYVGSWGFRLSAGSRSLEEGGSWTVRRSRSLSTMPARGGLCRLCGTSLDDFIPLCPQ